jgi:hypothetical protein
MNYLIVVPILALKFLLPVLYLWFPFAAGWANWLLDSVDGDLLMPAGLDFGLYQNLDKAADWTAYLFIFIWAWRRPSVARSPPLSRCAPSARHCSS